MASQPCRASTREAPRSAAEAQEACGAIPIRRAASRSRAGLSSAAAVSS